MQAAFCFQICVWPTSAQQIFAGHVTAVEQLSDLVAARLANMSTAMLRTASVSSAVDTKNFRQWQNYANYEHTVYFWHNNINYVYYASKPGLVPGTNPGLDA